MARGGRWALTLLAIAGCSELKPGTWVPDGATAVDVGPALDVATAMDAGPPCPRDRLRCGDRCVDPRNDRMNCGACGVRCGDCEEGRCD